MQCVYIPKKHISFGYQFHDVSCVYIYIYMLFTVKVLLATNPSEIMSLEIPKRHLLVRSFDPDQRMPPWETWCGGVLSWRLMRNRHTSGWWGWGWMMLVVSLRLWFWWCFCELFVMFPIIVINYLWMILIDLHSFTSLKNSVQSQPVTWDVSWHTQILRSSRCH